MSELTLLFRQMPDFALISSTEEREHEKSKKKNSPCCSIICWTYALISSTDEREHKRSRKKKSTSPRPSPVQEREIKKFKAFNISDDVAAL